MKGWVLLAATLLLVSVAPATSQILPWSVIGSGGTNFAQGNNRVLSATVGQVFIGSATITDGSDLHQGFWLPLDGTVSVDEGGSDLSGDVTNYPNPFTSTTTIRFNLPVDGDVTVRVFDLVGNLVRTLATTVSMAGDQEIVFDGVGDTGAPLANGTYLYEVSVTTPTGERIHRIQRMSIVR